MEFHCFVPESGGRRQGPPADDFSRGVLVHSCRCRGPNAAHRLPSDQSLPPGHDEMTVFIMKHSSFKSRVGWRNFTEDRFLLKKALLLGKEVRIALNPGGSDAVAMSHLRVLDVSGAAIRVTADDFVWAGDSLP